MKRISNYERLCLSWQEKTSKMDWQSLRSRLPELQPEGDYYTIIHFGRTYGIHAITGEIIALHDDQSVSCKQKLNIYTLLAYCTDGAKQSGQWVPFGDVRGASPFSAAYQKNILAPLAATFSGNVDALHAAALALGGIPLPQGDAGYLIHAFQCIPMQFLFWDGDDEFPAQANTLFDQHVTDFIHAESTVTLASEGLRRLAEAANLPILGNTYTVL